MKRYNFGESNFRDEVYTRIRKVIHDGCPLKRTLNVLPIEQGIVFAFLPDGFRFEDPAMLDMTFDPAVRAWTKEPVNLESMQEAVIKFIYEYVSAQEGHIALFDSVEWLQEAPQHTSYPYVLLEETDRERGRHVVYLATHHASVNDVAEAYKASRYQWPFLIVLTSEESPGLTTGVLTDADLEGLVSRTKYVLVGAFHQDTALIWERGM